MFVLTSEKKLKHQKTQKKPNPTKTELFGPMKILIALFMCVIFTITVSNIQWILKLLAYPKREFRIKSNQ